MAKELKVFISADASQAIKGMEGFTDSLSKMQKDVINASNNVDAAQQNLINNLTDKSAADEYAKSIVTLDKNTKKLLQRMQKEVGIMNQNGATVKELQKEYTKLGKVMNSLQLGQGNQDTKAINELKAWQNTIQDAIKGMKSGGADPNSYENQLAFYQAIGDEVGIAREKLAKYEKQLRASIATTGLNTKETRKLADAYKNQAQELEILEKQSAKADGRIKNLIKSFVSAQAVVYLVQKAFSLLKSAIVDWSAAAAAAEETANLFNTTFSDIQASANNLASEFASSMGTANTTMMQSLGLFGDLAIGYGQSQAAALEFAKQASALTLDIISFKNITGDTTEVMQAFASGLAGNFENFRKYGYIITQAEIKTRLQQKGLDKLTGSALQFAKVQETLNIIQEKAVNAQGDMIKTLDSTENLTRRVSEANKELMENLGRGINTILNPLKRVWLDIAESINDATEAQRLYDLGQKNISVYDIENNADDLKNFKAEIASNLTITDRLSDENGNNYFGLLNEDQETIDALIEVLTEFGASTSDAIAVFDDMLLRASDDFISKFIAAGEKLESERKEEAGREARAIEFSNIKDNAVNLLDSIVAVPGILSDTDYGASIAGMKLDTTGTRNLIQKWLEDGVNEAVNSLSSSVWQDFASLTDVVFGGQDAELSSLEAKAEAFVSIYELIYNAITTGTAELENSDALLSQIVESWKSVNAEIEAINAEAERLTKYEGALTDAQSSVTSTNDSLAKIGLSDKEAATYDIEKQRSEALSYAATQEEIDALNTVFNSLVESSNALYDAQDKLAKQEEYNSLIESARTGLDDARNENIKLGMNDRQSAAYDIALERSAAVKSAIDNGASDSEIAALVDIFDKWLKENERYYDKLADTAVSDYFAGFNSSSDVTYTYAGFGGNTAAQDAFNQAMKEGIEGFNELKAELEELGYSSEDLADIQSQAYEEIRNAAIDAGNAASAQASQDMRSGVFGNGMSALGEVGSLISSITDAASLAGGPMAILVEQLISLASQTELMTEITTLLSDAFVPVLDAFLKPLVPFIQSLGMVLQDLLYSALNPFYELMLSLGEILTMTVELLNPILEMIRTLSDYIGDYLYPIFAALSDLFSVLIEPLSVILNLLGDILLPILNLLTPVLDALAYAFTFVYAVINVVVNFVVDVFKWFVGTIVSFFTGMYNAIVNTLKKINILGWKPFGGLKTINDKQYQDWADINPFTNAQDNWDKAFELLDKNNKISMEIADNTSQGTDISQLEKVYEAGLISASEFEALVAEETGQKYHYKDDILSSSAQYVQNQTSTTISYGSVTININGYDGDARSLAREVKGILERDAKNPTFDMVG